MEQYLFLAVLLRFTVDCLLIMGVTLLTRGACPLGRCFLAALVGAFYATACASHRLTFLSGEIWRIVFLCIMALVAFGVDRAGRSILLIAMQLALDVLASQLRDARIVGEFMLAVGIWLLYTSVVHAPMRGGAVLPLEISSGDRHISLMALRDSGNSLRDPITGERVFVIDAQAARTLTGLSADALRTPLETLMRAEITGLRIIPYHAIGGSGMLLGMRFSEVKLDGRRCSAVIAFASHEIGRGEGYRALCA